MNNLLGDRILMSVRMMFTLGFLQAVFFLHHENDTPGLEELVPTDLRDESGKECIGPGPSSLERRCGQPQQGGIGLKLVLAKLRLRQGWAEMT